MLELKSSVGQQLTFNIDIHGASEKELVGKLRVRTENLEYGFNVNIEDGKIIADIPALDTIIPNLKDGMVLESSIDIIANKEFFTEAWQDKIKIIRPIEVKATVTEATQKSPVVKVTVTEGSSIAKKGKKLKPTPKAKDQKERYFPVKPVKNIEEKLDAFIKRFNR